MIIKFKHNLIWINFFKLNLWSTKELLDISPYEGFSLITLESPSRMQTFSISKTSVYQMQSLKPELDWLFFVGFKISFSQTKPFQHNQNYQIWWRSNITRDLQIKHASDSTKLLSLTFSIIWIAFDNTLEITFSTLWWTINSQLHIHNSEGLNKIGC